MTSDLNPYIGFKDTARAAMAFYQSVFGGELTISTFGDFGMAENPADADKVMHSRLITQAGFTLMAADTPPSMGAPGAGGNISISVSGQVEDAAELRGYWDKLSEGASVTVPLGPAPWGDTFGMLTDKFGVQWMMDFGTA